MEGSQPWPVATNFNSIDLRASVDFCVKMLGAMEVSPNISIPSSCDAEMAWIEFPGSGYQFRFISTPSLQTANFSFPDYVAYVDGLYGNLSEQNSSTYNQFMDFHLGMIVDDMTPYYEGLQENSIPFFMVGQYPSFFDLFVEIPGTGSILEITSQRLDDPDAAISLWDICQEQEQPFVTKQPQPSYVSSSLSRSPSQHGEFPTMNWRKTTFASPYPAMAEAFTIKYLGAKYTKQSHLGVNVKRCAKIAWSELEYNEELTPAGIPYQFHFVNGFKYPPFPPAMSIVDFAEYEEAHRDFIGDRWDEWANNRLTMWVDNLEPFLDAMTQDPITKRPPFFTPAMGAAVEAAASLLESADKERARDSGRTDDLEIPTLPFITRRWEDSSLFAMVIDTAPIAGHVIELVSDSFPSDKYPLPKAWDFCNKNEQQY